LILLSGDFVSEALTGGRWRQRFPIAFEYLNPLIDDLTKFRVDVGFPVTVAARADNTGALADEALIFLGPFHQLDVASTIVHEFDSSITRATSRS